MVARGEGRAHSRRLEGVVAAAMLLAAMLLSANANAGVVSPAAGERPTALGLAYDDLSAPLIV